MFRKLQLIAVLACMLSYAAAGTVSIGTASARGDLRVDSYTVKGNATLFDGSVVETGQASADLRLNKGTEITMANGSRGTLYADRLVLQKGESELSASSPFQLEASGLHVTPNQPNSRAVVSVRSENTIEVASLNGSFGVTNSNGALLANVLPGRSISFAMQAGGDSTAFSGVGRVIMEDGNYYLVNQADQKVLLTCGNFSNYVGKLVTITGTLEGTGAASKICVSTISTFKGAGLTQLDKWLIGGAVVGLGVGIGFAVSNITRPAASTP